MKAFYCLVAAVVTLMLAASPAHAVKMRFVLTDESIIIGDVDDKFTLEVETAYGILKIPAQDIATVDMGYHLIDEEEGIVAQAIKDLGSAAFKKREEATRALIKLGPRPYRLVHKADTTDLEIKERLDRYLSSTNPDSNKLSDVVTAKDLNVAGRILTKAIPVSSATLGHVNLPIAHLTRLTNGIDVRTTVQADADWQEIKGAKLVKNTAFDFAAKGSIDLWPQQAGQYVTGPDGHANTIGKGGVHKAGKLIGKIGASGAVFEIGEKSSITATETGPLYLKIVESPWNNASSGQYEVRIKQ
jgi:hypothetical protein